MKKSERPTLTFPCDFDERTRHEVEQKGWFEGAVVVMPEGSQIPMSFWDPVRLSQELEEETKLGHACFAELGLVVLPRVTPEHMHQALEHLAQTGYFDRLIALGQQHSSDKE